MAEKDKTQEQETIQLLQTLKEIPPRDPEKAAQGRQAFLSQAQEISKQPVSIPFFQRLTSVFNQPKSQLRFSTLTIGLILGFLLLTFSSSAIAARISKPDQPFYTYKLWLENSRLSLTSKSEKQIDLHLVFAEERLKELAEGSSDYSELGLDRAVHNLSDHVKALQSLLDEDQISDDQRERLDDILDQYDQYDEDELEDERETQTEDSSSGSEDDQPEKTEDVVEDEIDGDEEENESNKGKQSNDSEDSHHPEETDEPDEDDREPESTDEPDDDSSDNSGSSDEDPTETPEPDEGDD